MKSETKSNATITRDRLAALLNLEPVTTYSYNFNPGAPVLIQYGVYRQYFDKIMWLSLVYKAYVNVVRVSTAPCDDMYYVQELDRTKDPLYIGNLSNGEYRVLGTYVRDGLCYDRVRILKWKSEPEIPEITEDDKPLFTKEEYIAWFETNPSPRVNEIYKILKSRGVQNITCKSRKSVLKSIVSKYIHE